MTRWYEDIEIDSPYPLGDHTFTEAEILAFGRDYDPQYFHVDVAAAGHSHFGGIVASGWHTVLIGHRKMVDALDAEGERLRGLARNPVSPARPPASTGWTSRPPSAPATG